MKTVAWRVERGVEMSSDLDLTLGRYSLKFPSHPALLPSVGPSTELLAVHKRAF